MMAMPWNLRLISVRVWKEYESEGLQINPLDFKGCLNKEGEGE